MALLERVCVVTVALQHSADAGLAVEQRAGGGAACGEAEYPGGEPAVGGGGAAARCRGAGIVCRAASKLQVSSSPASYRTYEAHTGPTDGLAGDRSKLYPGCEY